MTDPVPSTRRGLLFWLGICLMVVSFALYPAYGLIAFLPISRWAKGVCYAAGWGLSWSLFFVGSLLAGKEGVKLLRERFSGVRFRSKRAMPGAVPPHPGPLANRESEQKERQRSPQQEEGI